MLGQVLRKATQLELVEQHERFWAKGFEGRDGELCMVGHKQAGKSELKNPRKKIRGRI